MPNYLYVVLLFILMSFNLKSQSLLHKSEKYIELNVSLSEVLLKPFLFNQFDYNERHQFTFQAEGTINLLLDEKWFIQMGLQYSLSRYKTQERFDLVISNPSGEDVFTNEFEVITENSFGRLESVITINVDQANCTNYDFIPQIEDGTIFPSAIGTFNSIDLLGIPIKFGRFIGKKNLKFYTNLSLIPKFVIRKNIDASEHKSVGVDLGAILGNNYCYSFPNERVIRMVASSNSVQTKWYLNDSRLDAIAEIGIVHKVNSNWLKIGLYYGESLTPYSDLYEKDNRLQQMGVRIGYAIESFKKNKKTIDNKM